MTLKQKLILLFIVFLAVFFRFYLIDRMPGGLFPDMAANGLDINLMQAGHMQPFYERGNGREALFFYMEWASVAIFGKGVWQFSIVSASIGLLAVLMCYFVAYRLMLMGGSQDDAERRKRAINIALLASFLMAVSSWHVVLSRTAFRATLIPLFSALTIYFLLMTYQAVTSKARFWSAFFCGASFALGFYTYIAFRIMAPILFMVLLWPLLAQIKQSRFWQKVNSYKLPVISFAIAFVIFILPIANYFYTHTSSFLGRSGQVSVFNPDLYTVNGTQLKVNKAALPVVLNVMAEVTKQSLLGFFTQGDLNWRHNISGQPFLSQLVSPFFGVGLLLISLMGIVYFFLPNKKSHWWKYFLLTGWFWGMLLPVITTAEGIPHGLRAVGLIPPVFIISAWVLYRAVELIMAFHRRVWHRCEQCHDKPMASVGLLFRKTLATFGIKLAAVCFFAALIFQTYFLYFVYAYNSPENFYYFRSDLTPVSEYLVERCNKNQTYLIIDTFSVQTTDYLTSDRYGNFSDKCNVPYKQVDPERSWQLSNLKQGDQIVFVQSSIFDTKKFKQYHPEAYLKMEIRNKFSQTVMAVYEIN